MKNKIIQKKCEHCGELISLKKPSGRNRSIYDYKNLKFCGRECSANNKAKVPIKEKYCKQCGDPIPKKRKNYLLNPSTYIKVNFCGPKCRGLWNRIENPTRSASQERLKYLIRKEGAHCDFCKTKQKLVVHHIDKNWRNNELENLQVLCNRCHVKLHHRDGDISPKKERKPCDICGEKSKYALRNLCSKHYGRWIRCGKPNKLEGVVLKTNN